MGPRRESDHIAGYNDIMYAAGCFMLLAQRLSEQPSGGICDGPWPLLLESTIDAKNQHAFLNFSLRESGAISARRAFANGKTLAPKPARSRGGYEKLLIDEQPEEIRPVIEKLLNFADRSVAHRSEGHDLQGQPEMWDHDTVLEAADALLIIGSTHRHPSSSFTSDEAGLSE